MPSLRNFRRFECDTVHIFPVSQFEPCLKFHRGPFVDLLGVRRSPWLLLLVTGTGQPKPASCCHRRILGFRRDPFCRLRFSPARRTGRADWITRALAHVVAFRRDTVPRRRWRAMAFLGHVVGALFRRCHRWLGSASVAAAKRDLDLQY